MLKHDAIYKTIYALYFYLKIIYGKNNTPSVFSTLSSEKDASND